MKAKGVPTQMKALKRYILLVMFLFIVQMKSSFSCMKKKKHYGKIQFADKAPLKYQNIYHYNDR